MGEEKESRCEELEFQTSNVSLHRAGTQSSTHLLTSWPGHPVTSELRHQSVGLAGINTGSDSQRDTSSGIVALTTTLSLQQQEQQPQLRLKSLPLLSLEKEAIRTHGCHWSGCSALRLPSFDWYRVWRTFKQMGDRKRKVVRHLEF